MQNGALSSICEQMAQNLRVKDTLDDSLPVDEPAKNLQHDSDPNSASGKTHSAQQNDDPASEDEAVQAGGGDYVPPLPAEDTESIGSEEKQAIRSRDEYLDQFTRPEMYKFTPKYRQKLAAHRAKSNSPRKSSRSADNAGDCSPSILD